MNNKVSFSNNMDNMLLRTGYKIFYAHPGGRQHSRQNLGDYWVSEAECDGQCHTGIDRGSACVARMNGGDTGSPGSSLQAVQTPWRSGSVTGLHAVLCSLNFKSDQVKLQHIASRNEQRLQRSPSY